MSEPVSVSPGEINDATGLITDALERVEKEQGIHESIKAAIKNIYGNAAYLAVRLDPADIFRVFADVQGELIEGIIEQAAVS